MAGHSHSHSTSGYANHRKALITVLSMTAGVLVFEVIGAWLSGSLALLADAGHVFTDSAGLVLALIGATLVTRPETNARTWGFRRIEVLAAAGQALLLLGVGTFVIVEAVRRFFDPQDVDPVFMIGFGVIGLVANLVSMMILLKIENGNLNMRAALLEVINDALGSVSVVVAGIIIATTGWAPADSVVSIIIGSLIFPRSWKLLRETVHVLMESTPKNMDLDVLRAHIVKRDGVTAVHDLHASLVGTDLPVVSAHVAVTDEMFTNGKLPALLTEIQECLHGHFDVEHSTIQFEPEGHRSSEHAAHP
ncbi:MAG: hypothetical protein RL431_476 [Actinomycetota bacterium]